MFLGSFGMKTFQATIKATTGILKAPAGKEQYIDLLKMMYQLFNVARKEGLLGLEKHIENPETSDIISKFPSFLSNHHAVHFFCDTLKVILTGAVGPHDLSEMMELDLETAHHEEMKPSEALQTIADGMPAIGIVAAVLGVIITMGSIAAGPEVVGEKVAAALVGTFLGIFVGYGMVGPVAKRLEHHFEAEGRFFAMLKAGILANCRGLPPQVSVEFARRTLFPSDRPSFKELEEVLKNAAANAAVKKAA